MSSPFEIMSLSEGWSVTWPAFPGQFFSIKNNRLLDVLFGTIKCDEAGVVLRLQGDNADTMWIDKTVWAQDVSDTYSFYLEEQYEILGVVLKEERHATELHDWLEKQYMWKILND